MTFHKKYSGLYKKGELGIDFEVPVTKEDYLQRMRYYYGMYAYGATSIGYGGVFTDGRSNRSMKELRDYARGLQGVKKFMDTLDPVSTKGANRGKRTLNISWDILRVTSKFRNIMKDKFLSVLLMPKTEAVDETARLERLSKKNFMVLMRQEATKAFLQNTKFVPDQGPEEEGMETASDVQFIYELGGIRLAAEIVMKDGIDLTLNKSGWDIIWPMCIEDIIDLNSMATDQVRENGIEKVKYVDPAKIIVKPSIYPDFRDSPFRGYIEYMQLNEITRMADLEHGEINQIKNVYLAGNTTYSGTNEGSNSGFREDYARASGRGYSFSEFGVQVQHMYFIVEHEERYLKGMHKKGSKQFEPVGPDFKLTSRMKKAGKTIETYPVQFLYKCSWVVGTDVVFNEGLVDTVVRDGQDGSKSIVWPMTIIMGHEPSIVERMISFDDDIQICNFKQRAMIKKLPPAPRMVVYKSRVSDSVSIGNDNYTILEMSEMYQRHGIWVMEDSAEYSLPGEENPAGQKPFDFLESGIDRDMVMLENRILQLVDKLRQVTGINEITDGTNQTGDVLKHVAQSAEGASNSALRPHVDLMVSGYKSIITHIGLKFKHMVLEGDIRMGYLPVSDNYTRMVTLDKSLAKYDWGIMVDVESRESQQMLLQDLMSRKDMLPADSYFIIFNTVMSGDLKKAQFLLSKYSQKQKELLHKQQMEIAQATASGNAQAAIAGEEAKAKTIQLQSQINAQARADEFQYGEKTADAALAREKEKLALQEKMRKETAVATVEANNRNRLDQ